MSTAVQDKGSKSRNTSSMISVFALQVLDVILLIAHLKALVIVNILINITEHSEGPTIY